MAQDQTNDRMGGMEVSRESMKVRHAIQRWVARVVAKDV